MISQDISKVTGQMRVLSGKHKSFKTNALQMIYTPNTPKLLYVFKGNLFRTQGNLKLFLLNISCERGSSDFKSDRNWIEILANSIMTSWSVKGCS